MIIHCTQKLATKLHSAGLNVSAEALGSDSALGAWHANITTIQRRQCLVFCHDQTRLTLAMVGVTAKELKKLDYLFDDLFANVLLKAGIEPELIEEATEHFSPLQFDTTCDRSVQATLRLMIQGLESFTWDGTSVIDLPIYSTSVRLNETPCRVKGMKESECLWPIEEMRRLLGDITRSPDGSI